jgi:spore coat protein CotH
MAWGITKRGGVGALALWLLGGCWSPRHVVCDARVAEHQGLRTADYVFDPEELRTYELEIDERDWRWLNRHARDEDYVLGRLRFEGEVWEQIGVRYKGAVSLRNCFDEEGERICSKLSLKLKFNVCDESRFHGLKKLNFHSNRSDPSLLRERLAYSLFGDMGCPASRAAHAHLEVNGDALGLFTLVEQVDGRFARMRFPDGGEGNVYKAVWPTAGTSEENYLEALETNEEEGPSVQAMLDFAEAVAGATEESALGVLERWTDLEVLTAFLAVDRSMDNWDGIVGWWCHDARCRNHNYYWYQETDRDKLWLIPWDLDKTFQVPNPLIRLGQPPWDDTEAPCEPIDLGRMSRRAAACDPLIRWLATSLRPKYLLATRELLQGPLCAAAVDEKIDAWQAQIEAAVTADEYGPRVEDWHEAVEELRQDLQRLRARAEELVAAR